MISLFDSPGPPKGFSIRETSIPDEGGLRALSAFNRSDAEVPPFISFSRSSLPSAGEEENGLVRVARAAQFNDAVKSSRDSSDENSEFDFGGVVDVFVVDPDSGSEGAEGAAEVVACGLSAYL